MAQEVLLSIKARQAKGTADKRQKMVQRMLEIETKLKAREAVLFVQARQAKETADKRQKMVQRMLVNE